MTQKITDVLDRLHVIPGLNAQDKSGLLREMSQRAGVALKLDEETIFSCLMTRENLGSTGVGGGVAIPHARLVELQSPFGMFARLQPTIDFAAIDSRPVDLVFLLLTPDRAAAANLSLLAAISRKLRDSKTVAAIRASDNGRDIYQLLTAE